jgi:transcriptional regulator with XRE-family HTH domain
MTRLLAIIDDYKDRHGQPPDAAVARAIGVKPQTLSSWRKRGMKEPPHVDSLRKLAALAGVDYETVVLRAVLIDVGWVEPPAEEEGPAEEVRGA